MEILGTLLQKTFVTEKGEIVEYYVVEYQIDEETTIDVKLKSDKAKLLLMAEKLKAYED